MADADAPDDRVGVSYGALRDANPGVLSQAADGIEVLRGKFLGYSELFGALKLALQSDDRDLRLAAAKRAELMRADALHGVEVLEKMDLAVQQGMQGFSMVDAFSALMAKYQDRLREAARAAAYAAAELTSDPPPSGD